VDCGCFLLFWQRCCPLRFGCPCVGFLRRGKGLCVTQVMSGGMCWGGRGGLARVCVTAGVGSWGRRGR